MNAPNPWHWWQSALADYKKIGKELPIHENEPHIGYYRKKTGRGEIGWIPVAITADGDQLVAVVGHWATGLRVPATEEWTWCCRYPVSYDTYQAVAVRGEEWPDSIKTILKGEPAPKADKPVAAEGGDGRGVEIGDNAPAGDEDPLVLLRDKIEDLVGRALAEAEKAGRPTPQTWGPEWQVKADRLANYTVTIAELRKQVETAFDVEKRPHLLAGRAVDDRWRPVKARGEDAVKKLKGLLTPFLQAKAAYEAEQSRVSAERARLAAPPSLDPTEDTGAAVPEAKATAKVGTMGRAVSLRKRTVAKMTDTKAFAAYLLGWDQPSPELLEVMLKIANKLVANGAHKMGEIPGVTAEEIEVAQ